MHSREANPELNQDNRIQRSPASSGDPSRPETGMRSFARCAGFNWKPRPLLRTTALILLIITCWLVGHRYRALGYDAQLYAFQALAHINPAFRNDLFVLNSSQDHYSVFSPVYAVFIRLMGLDSAALWLWAIGLAAFLVSTWHLARLLSDRSLAWLSTALVVIISSAYGGYEVIRYAEEYLTARTFAEAFTVTALAAWFAGRHWLSGLFIALALALHPIMALPGLAVLVFLNLRARWSLALAVSAIAGTVVFTLMAQAGLLHSSLFAVIDPQWMYMVRERSQYILLSLWTWPDWQLNLRPLLSLALTALASSDPRIRKLCLMSALVGLTGLGIAAVACLHPPLALLVQAQPWRALWLATFIAILLLPVTVIALWKEPRCGLVCIVLLVLAWTYPLINQLASVGIALALFAVRHRIGAEAARVLRTVGPLLVVVIACWLMAIMWGTIRKPFDSGHGPLALQTLQNVLGLTVPLVILLVGLWWTVMRSQSTALLGVICVLLSALCVPWAPLALEDGKAASLAYRPDDFADWRKVMRPDGNVLVGEQGSSAQFIWFMLQRPAYLTEAQSAGLVFSRKTALEVRRRSDLIAGFVDPTWKIYSSLEWYKRNPGHWKPARTHPLTAPLLQHLCSDPQLAYVIAKEDVGFGALTHTGRGFWHGWNLYDCARARGTST